MKVEIDGKIQQVPNCTCGKCIVKRIRKDHFLSYPYNKGLKSCYKGDYPNHNMLARSLNDPSTIYNKAKGSSGFDGVYKDNIPTLLMSTQKMDYKPFKINFEPVEPTNCEVEKAPFFGSSTYKTFYNNWGSTKEDKAPLEKLPEIKIPLRGSSNYKESYPKFPQENYIGTNCAIVPKSTLEFYGKLNPDTSYGNTFMPVDFKQPHYFNNDGKKNKKNSEKSSFVPAEFPPSNFESSYATSIGNYDRSSECKLKEFLKKKGKTCLEI